MKAVAALIVAVCLAACATTPISAPLSPTGSGRPTGEIDLGDWRGGSARAVAQRFSQTVAQRYAAGAPLTQATSDLRGQRFDCAAGERDGRGSPPSQVCRREIRNGACAHTWQVHLFADDGRLARTRGLYDRTCGDDGLLGG
ncbi:MAG: hypothetical protein GC206_10050 [Alphaproteobacteria bacterium]|nr:hypothetical protein [Alphaproteobacteria bacterium]